MNARAQPLQIPIDGFLLTIPEEPKARGLILGSLAFGGYMRGLGYEAEAKAEVVRIAAWLERERAAPEPVGKIELPDDQRGRSADDLKRLDVLNRRLAKPLPKGDKKAERDREEWVAERDALEARPALAEDRRWSQRAIEETIALADARGAKIEADRSGMTRVIGADVLFNLASDGRITPDQMNTGREVRDLYDSRAQDAGAMEYTGMPSGGHDHEKFVAARFTRAKASEFIGRIERAVAIHCSQEPASLVALRAVCERGWPLSSMGAGRALERNCRALARALDVADDVLRRRL